MPELYREASEEDLKYARKPLDDINPQRVQAYKARHRNIEKVYDQAIKAAFQRTRTSRDRFSTAESRELESEKDRKLAQLKEEFKAMLDPTLFEAAKKMWTEFENQSPYKPLSRTYEAASYGSSAATLATGGVAMGLQVGATGLLLSNPFTATLAVLNELDKWVGRAIGWYQMAKNQWDADCSRISIRVATAIKDAKGDSDLNTARSGGWFSSSAEQSTITRQRLERILYKRILKIREESIKYKIRETEVTAEAQKILEQKRAIEPQVHAINHQVDGFEREMQNLPPNSFLMVEGRKKLVREHVRELKQKSDKLVHKCIELSEKIADLLNQVVSNADRLINKSEADASQFLNEVVQSFAKTEYKGKMTGAHDHGAWLGAIRRAF